MSFTKNIGFASALFLLTSCSSIANKISDEPIALDPNERTWGQWVDDQSLETIAAVNIKKSNPAFEKEESRIKVVSYNGNILLLGQVPNTQLKALAQSTVQSIPQVKQIYNELTIDQPTTLLIQSNDAVLTTKIKARLVSSKDVSANQIIVNTENGTAFLMGMTTAKTAQEAADIASKTPGVQKVVKVFEYLE